VFAATSTSSIRSGLNENHGIVKELYAALDRVLRPIVADEERRAGARIVRAGGARRARDQVGLRALNDALKGAWTTNASSIRPGLRPLSAIAARPKARQIRHQGLDKSTIDCPRIDHQNPDRSTVSRRRATCLVMDEHPDMADCPLSAR
jgi:hypothetical protein